MSYERRCDICDKGDGEWMLRKRWKFFTIHGAGEYCWDVEMDICDKCFGKFKVWVNQAVEPLNK